MRFTLLSFPTRSGIQKKNKTWIPISATGPGFAKGSAEASGSARGMIHRNDKKGVITKSHN